MARRTEARRLAVEILYQADLTGTDAGAVLEERRAVGDRIPGFARELVGGVSGDLEGIDELIQAHLEGWTLARLNPVDRAILRVACYEILSRDDVPQAVAIDEAVDAAKALSTEESGGFVNGILGRIARELSDA